MVNILASTPTDDTVLFTVINSAVSACCCLLFICCCQCCLTSCLAGFHTDYLVLLHHLSKIAALPKASTSLSCSTSDLSPLLPTSSLNMSTVTNLVAISPHGLLHHTTAAHHPWTTTPIIHCTYDTHSHPPLHQSHSCHQSLINPDCFTTPAPHSHTHI